MLEHEDKKEILDAIQGLSVRMDEFGAGQQEMRGSIKSLEQGQQEMQGSIKSLEQGQQEMRTYQQEMRGSIKSLEEGLQETHEMIQEFSLHVDQRFAKIEATMVTKDYLDDKLAEHGSYYGELIRQTNGKIHVMADALVKEKSLSSISAKKITSSAPFGRR